MPPSKQTQADLDAELPALRSMLRRLEADTEKRAALRENFEEKITQDGDKHVWRGSTNNIGYPKMKVDGEMVLASHIALRLAGRKPPSKDQVVMHRDNNIKNLNPSNLQVGTQVKNLKQMRDEGRDRPRGVPQKPDKIASASLSAFFDEVQSILRDPPRG